MPDRRHRLFVALEVPDAVRHRLHAVAVEMATGSPTIRPTPIERIHATLLFIGETTTTDMEALAPALFDAISGPPIETRLGAIIARPRPGSARLVAAEYADPGGRVAAIAASMATAVADVTSTTHSCGRFWPHITIARFSRPTRMRRCATPGGEHVFAFNRITLYDSVITSSGPPRYHALMTVPLDLHRERKSPHG